MRKEHFETHRTHRKEKGHWKVRGHFPVQLGSMDAETVGGKDIEKKKIRRATRERKCGEP